MAEVKLPTAMNKAVVQKLQDQLIKKVTLEEEGLTNEEEVMAEAGEMPITITSVTSGDTDVLNVLKVIKQEKEEHMLLNRRKLRHHLKKWITCLRQERPWC